MTTCTISPEDRRAQVELVGKDLVETYGKKDFYTVDEVKAANQRQKIGFDYVCFSHAVFNTHADFDAYHRSIGEVCDYAAMKQTMLEAMSSARDASWFNTELSWLQFPDLDLSSIFDL